MLGIIAGTGDLPFIAAGNAFRAGIDFKIFLVKGQDIIPNPPFPDKTIVVEITRWGHTLKTLKKNKIDKVLLLGKIEKSILYNKPRFDFRALYILARLANKNDSSIFLALASDMASKGIEVLSQKIYLAEMFLKAGYYGYKRISAKLKKDAIYGFSLAKQIADLDIGQTVVVAGQAIMAIEAIEGTNEAIRRGALLAAKKKAVVCKVARAKQDYRFDIPTIGSSTLDVMAEASISVLVFEAEKTFIVNPEKLCKKAKDLKITLWGISAK